MNADLERSLTSTYKTIASVNSLRATNSCQNEANDFWVRTHLGQSWSILTIDLLLLTVLTQAQRSLVTEKRLGVLKPELFQTRPFSLTLVVYITDKYTERWVHDCILTVAKDPSNRILNIQRDDKSELIDLTL